MSGEPFVFIKRTGYPDEDFAPLNIDGLESVAHLAERACTKFKWAVQATQVKLYLTADSEDGSNSQAAEESALRGSCLGARSTLEKAKVVHRSSLLALFAASASASSPPTQGKNQLSAQPSSPLSPSIPLCVLSVSVCV